MFPECILEFACEEAVALMKKRFAERISGRGFQPPFLLLMRDSTTRWSASLPETVLLPSQDLHSQCIWFASQTSWYLSCPWVSSDIHVRWFFCLRNSGLRRYWKDSPRLRDSFPTLNRGPQPHRHMFFTLSTQCSVYKQASPTNVQVHVTGIDDLGHWHHHLSSDY